MTEIEWHPSVKNPGTSGRFYIHPKLNPLKSNNAGKPVYDDVLMVEIRANGLKDTFSKKVDETVIAEFPGAHEAFKGNDVPIDGTPLEELPGITAELLAIYRMHAVRTVEQMADLTDGAVSNMPRGAFGHRQVARLMVDNARLNRVEKAPEKTAEAAQAEKSLPVPEPVAEAASEAPAKRRGRPRKAA